MPKTHPDFARWEKYLSSARNGHSRPLENNTRVEWMTAREGGDAIGIRLHSTVVVTINRDGSRILRANGWHTNTTADRIRSYGCPRFGGWSVPVESDPNDPRPPDAQRTVFKPFTVPDPGPEPVKSPEGCIAGSRELYSYQHARYDFQLSAGEELHPDPTYTGHLLAAANGVIEWTEDHGYRYGPPETTVIGGEGGEYHREFGRWVAHAVEAAIERKQCRHCKAFDELHERWHVQMYGARWGRHRERGYSQMCEALERYGTREEWRDAYLADFRECKRQRVESKAWAERNNFDFYDGIEVTPQGYVPLARKRQWVINLARQTRQREKAERRAERLRRAVERQQAPILKRQQREREEREQVQRIARQALAGSLLIELENKRAESFIAA